MYTSHCKVSIVWSFKSPKQAEILWGSKMQVLSVLVFVKYFITSWLCVITFCNYSLLKWCDCGMEISMPQSFVSRCCVCNMFLRGARILHRCRGVLAQTVWFFCWHNWARVGSLAGNSCSHVCLRSQEVSNWLQQHIHLLSVVLF